MELKGLPDIIVSFLSYKLNIQGCSRLTVDEYLLDLRCFFRYVISKRSGVNEKEADLSVLDDAFADSVTENEVYDYLLNLAVGRSAKPTTRCRKLSCIKSFYKFHTTKSHRLKNNPAENVDSPKKQRQLPIFLSLDESKRLLDSFDPNDPFFHRNYMITLLFLNSGIRLSELVGISLSDIDSDMTRFVVHGKGSKDRMLYFNEVCREELKQYLAVREKIATSKGHKIKDSNALFLSANGNRISQKTVQWLIKRQLELSGLSERGYSVHKLRHTAATLMYNESKVDVLVLKDILGHEQLSTTQIYAHVNKDGVKKALDSNPLNLRKADNAKSEGTNDDNG